MTGLSDGDRSRIVDHALVPPVGTFQLHSVHTFVSFTVHHLVVGSVRGRFETVQRTVTVAEDASASPPDDGLPQHGGIRFARGNRASTSFAQPDKVLF